MNLGSTSDIVVSFLLALSQLIEPVPESAFKTAEAKIKERNACAQFQTHDAEYRQKRCERLKENRNKYKQECQQLENDRNLNEMYCATDPEVLALLHFRPKPLQTYMQMPNAQLVPELNRICLALQDRAFLEREQWTAGETSNRDDLGTKLVILLQPELQSFVSKVLKEAADGELITGDVYKVVTALCHWKVDRKALAERVDFTSGYKYLQNLLNELPNVNELPELPQASFVYDAKDRRIGEIFDREFTDRAGKRYLSKVHRRRLVSAAEIPRRMYHAFTAIEDKRFNEHNGFDFEAIKRLYYGGVQGSKQGGSTFTMQLVKNAFFDADVENERGYGKRTLRRKLKEILMIPMVEKRYSKDEILAYYLNLIDLTPDAQGIKMASIDLFGKPDLNQLTLPEVALLAALPKGISKYNPHRNPEEAKLRRDTVIKVMEEQGFISATEKAAAQAQPIRLVPKTGSDRQRVLSRYFNGHLSNYFGKLKRQNLRDPRWLLGGFDIRTGYDADLQEILTKSVQQGLTNYEASTPRPGRGDSRLQWSPWLDDSGKAMNIRAKLTPIDAEDEVPTLSEIFFALKVAHPYPETGWLMAVKLPKENLWTLETGEKAPVHSDDREIFRRLVDFDLALVESSAPGSVRLGRVPTVQGAGVVMNLETGDILALTGGFSAGAYGKFAQNNRATVSLREPGSTIKPITYLYALNRGIQPTDLLSNGPVRFPKVKNCPYQWSPKNYSDSGAYQMSVRTALQGSANRSLMNLFINMSGFRSVGGGTDLSGATAEQKDQLTGTLDGIYDFAAHFGAYPDRSLIPGLRRHEPCFPFLLGGYETTVLNMAQVYAAIGNGGLKRDAVFLKEVLKAGDPILIDRSLERENELHAYRDSLKYGFSRAPEAFKAITEVNPIAVAQLRYMMQGILSNGTATRISRWSHLIGGKTGTTNSSRDVWFAGFTNKIAVVIWVGYDDAKVYKDLGEKRTGGSVALPIFENFMESYFKLHPEALEDPLPLPSELPGVVKHKVDPESGYVYRRQNGVCRAPKTAIDEYFPARVLSGGAAGSSCADQF
jgi:penicillin-binding protein 1A